MGRKSEYKPIYCSQILSFFDIPETKTLKIITTGKNDYRKEEEKEVANSLPHMIDFARKIGVTPDCLLNWSKTFPEFGLAYKQAKEINERFLANNALRNLYSASFAIFMAKNKFGWRDESYLKTTLENLISFNIPKDTSSNRLLDMLEKIEE